MAIEAKRGRGYRKIGGTYLVADGPGFPCGRFPIELIACPLCDHRPPFTRGIQRITPKNILHAAPTCRSERAADYRISCAAGCPLNKALEAETAGLNWVGQGHYTPDEFIAEATGLGISKRVSSVPKWLKLGTTWVFLAHEQTFADKCEKCGGLGEWQGHEASACNGGHGCAGPDCACPCHTAAEECPACEGEGKIYRPGVFYAFRPQRVERIIPDTMPPAERKKLHEREPGLTLVVEVPHDDPDHAGGKRGEED